MWRLPRKKEKNVLPNKMMYITANLLYIWRVLDFCLLSNSFIFITIIFRQNRWSLSYFAITKSSFRQSIKNLIFCDLFFLISSHPLNKEKLEYNLIVFHPAVLATFCLFDVILDFLWYFHINRGKNTSMI